MSCFSTFGKTGGLPIIFLTEYVEDAKSKHFYNFNLNQIKTYGAVISKSDDHFEQQEEPLNLFTTTKKCTENERQLKVCVLFFL